MRISDWSSDVCSSDLHDVDDHVRPCRSIPPLGPASAAYSCIAGRNRRLHRIRAVAFRSYGSAHLAQGQCAFGADLSRGSVDACHRSEEHTSELQSLMRISYAVFCLKKKKTKPRKKTYD